MMRKKMLKMTLCFVTLCMVPFAYSSDIFGAYMRGAETARRANWEDAQNHEQQRYQLINRYTVAYNNTGDWRYVYLAAELGSPQALAHLQKHQVTCGRNNSGNVICGR